MKNWNADCPPGAQETGDGAIPVAAFPRRALRWTGEEGGASVDRCRHAQSGTADRRKRSTIRARAGDIRKLADEEGNRLWSVTDRPVPGNRAHAEIQREPRGKMPGRAERARFMEAWRFHCAADGA